MIVKRNLIDRLEVYVKRVIYMCNILHIHNISNGKKARMFTFWHRLSETPKFPPREKIGKIKKPVAEFMQQARKEIGRVDL